MTDEKDLPPEWVIPALEEYVQAKFMKDMFERYNPKYVPVAEEAMKRSVEEIARLIRLHAPASVVTEEDVLDDLDI